MEGEGALRVLVEDGQVREVQLRIYEPPRFFEAFLRGRLAACLPQLMGAVLDVVAAASPGRRQA